MDHCDLQQTHGKFIPTYIIYVALAYVRSFGNTKCQYKHIHISITIVQCTFYVYLLLLFVYTLIHILLDMYMYIRTCVHSDTCVTPVADLPLRLSLTDLHAGPH